MGLVIAPDAVANNLTGLAGRVIEQVVAFGALGALNFVGAGETVTELTGYTDSTLKMIA